MFEKSQHLGTIKLLKYGKICRKIFYLNYRYCETNNYWMICVFPKIIRTEINMQTLSIIFWPYLCQPWAIYF